MEYLIPRRRTRGFPGMNNFPNKGRNISSGRMKDYFLNLLFVGFRTLNKIHIKLDYIRLHIKFETGWRKKGIPVPVKEYSRQKDVFRSIREY